MLQIRKYEVLMNDWLLCDTFIINAHTNVEVIAPLVVLAKNR